MEGDSTKKEKAVTERKMEETNRKKREAESETFFEEEEDAESHIANEAQHSPLHLADTGASTRREHESKTGSNSVATTEARSKAVIQFFQAGMQADNEADTGHAASEALIPALPGKEGMNQKEIEKSTLNNISFNIKPAGHLENNPVPQTTARDREAGIHTDNGAAGHEKSETLINELLAKESISQSEIEKTCQYNIKVGAISDSYPVCQTAASNREAGIQSDNEAASVALIQKMLAEEALTQEEIERKIHSQNEADSHVDSNPQSQTADGERERKISSESRCISVRSEGVDIEAMDETAKERLLRRMAEESIRAGTNRFLIRKGDSGSIQVIPKKVSESDTDSDSSDSGGPKTSATLEEALSKWKDTKTKESSLNEYIKLIPSECARGDSSHLSSVLGHLALKCRAMLKKNPAVCDHVDGEGRTPLHNLMEKLLIGGLWKQILDYIILSDSLWNLLSQLVTEENVNIRDKNQVTPYSWILMWQELARFHDASDKPKLIKKIEDAKTHFQEKGAIEEDAAHGVGICRHRRIEEKIQHLKKPSLERQIRDILKIFEEGEITFPTKGPSIMKKLLGKTDACLQEPYFAKLVKKLHSKLSGKGDLVEDTWGEIGWPKTRNKSIVEEFIAKLKIFIPLDDGFSTRFLHKLTHGCQADDWNVHFVEVLIYLIGNGANPFQQIGGTVSFAMFLDKYDSDLNDRLMFSITTFLEQYLGLENILNDVIKAVPTDIFEIRSSHYSSIKDLLVGSCLNMIRANPALCDHVDDKGRTPLHNLMEKLLIGGLWKRIPDFVAGVDSLWNLMYKLITEKNKNIRDKDQVTPFSWVLLWQESVMSYNVKDKQKLRKKIEDFKKHFQEKGASEEDATHLFSTLREKEMEGLLKRLIKFNTHMDDQLKRSERTIEEIVAELEEDLERIRYLKSRGCGECITRLTGTVALDLLECVKKHIEIRNDRILGISAGMWKVIIVEANAQAIYDLSLQHKRGIEGEYPRPKVVNYYALFDVLKWCLDNGAHPKIAEIHEISLLNAKECQMYEGSLATVLMLEQLIDAYRKQGNADPVEIYLNPMQDQEIVKEDLRSVASTVIRAAYGTLSNCMKSKSVINALLFLSKDDSDDDIKKCFEKADALLQGDMRDPPVTKWVEEKGEHVERHSQKGREQEIELRWTLIKRNDNWLRRSVLHLAAIFCLDEKVLNCIPIELIKAQIDQKDLNGCTPMDLAHLHGNMSAIKSLKSHNARDGVDCSVKFPERSPVDHDEDYKKHCLDVLERKSFVFENMKKLLVLSVDECKAIEEDLMKLFSKMVADDEFLDAEIVMGGSVREKLKVGRWDEFDLQLFTKIRPYGLGQGRYENEPFASLRLHEHLVKKMAEVDKEGISLRCISVEKPWKFIWEGEGRCRGLGISVDVVPICVEGNSLENHRRMGWIIDVAPRHQPLLHMKWRDFESEPDWNNTLCRYEWDILHNLPPGCHLGILISKALLEALYQNSGTNLLKRQITSYMVKNALLWLLAGETPRDIESIHGNVIGERYGALRQQLQFTRNDPKWMTETDFEKFAEEGRFWAEKIFDAIQFLAREYRMALGSFLGDDTNKLFEAHDVIDVVDTCRRCLEKLRPQVFFAEEACALSDKPGGDAGLRTRLQEVISRLNEEAETVPGARLWKMRREVKKQTIRIDNFRSEWMKDQLTEEQTKCRGLEDNICTLLLELDETQSALLNEKEGECEELSKEIDKFIEELRPVNCKKSVLFRIRGEIEELERNKNNGLMGQQPAREREEELARKKTECAELEEEVEALHQANRSHMAKLEMMITEVFPTDSNEDDKLQAPTKESLSDNNANMDQPNSITSSLQDSLVGPNTLNTNLGSENNVVSEDDARTCYDDILDDSGIPQGESDVAGAQQLPGYDPNDVLRGGELDITTMDKYAFLCGLPSPSVLLMEVMTCSPIIPQVDVGEDFTAIHYVNNHYLVSCQRNGRIVLYDSLSDDQHIQQIFPQLARLYQVGSDESNIDYLVPQSQGDTSDCGLFAAANATMLIHGIDPFSVTLDGRHLRSHMHQCLQDEKVCLFPCLSTQKLAMGNGQDDELQTPEPTMCNKEEDKGIVAVKGDLAHSLKKDSSCKSQKDENEELIEADEPIATSKLRQQQYVVAPNRRHLLGEYEDETSAIVPTIADGGMVRDWQASPENGNADIEIRETKVEFWIKENEALKKENEALKKEMEEKLKGASDRNAALLLDRDEFKRELHDASGRYAALLMDRDEVKRENERLEGKLSQTKEELQRLLSAL